MTWFRNCVRLAPGGCLAFTFIDPRRSSCRELWLGTNLEWRLEQVRKSNPEFNPALFARTEPSRGMVRLRGRQSSLRQQRRRW